MGRVKISYDEAVKQGLTKECSKCHKVKSVTEFSRQKTGKYGAESKCKKCKAKYKEQHYQEHREEIAKYRQEHREEINNRQRKYNQEHREEIANYQKQYNQTPKGKENRRKYQKQYLQTPKGKEKSRKAQKQYRQTPQGKENSRKRKQKRRALKNQSFYQPFTQEDKEFCLSFFNHTCPYSGKPLTNSEIHIDHIVPLSDKNGVGATAPWNLLTCSASINMSKSNKPVLEFINSLPNSDEVYNNIRNYIILQAKKYIDHVPKDDITLKTFNISFDELEEAV